MAKRRMRIGTVLRRGIFGIIAACLLLVTPGSYAFAESADTSTPSASTSCSPVAPAPTGISRPTGDDAGTYTYNSCTGLWENAYYTWSPATQIETPKTPYVYSCDTSLWHWTTMKWIYDPAISRFQQVRIVVTTLPAGAVIALDSVVPCVAPAPNTTPVAGTSTSAVPSAPSSTTQVNTNASASNTATIGNQIGSVATTGNATLLSNTTAGNATSGNATVVANVMNAVQSSTALNGGNVKTFVANISGDVQGNLIIDPNQLQPASTSAPLTNTNVTVNAQNSGQINNNITLAANSGNATVADNTSAGNATSGNAAAVANVVNMLNSVISAGQSFVGVINITGNMHGDILMPQSFLDSLVASNAPSTTVTLSPTQATNLGITSTNNTSITNAVHNSATTGNATVADNTSAGNAMSGTASTKVTIFNLTGNQVVGKNCLLVFVNVSGTWVGVIMNAPAGTTAAALGSGIAGNTVNTATINATNNNSITNNIDVAAASGNARVSGNTNAGNATSGNADTAVNLLNLDNSTLNLSGWFGILFINIFGNWYGSFGVYTPSQAPTSGSAHQNPMGTPGANRSKVFQFVPLSRPQPTFASSSNDTTPIVSVGAHLADATGKVLAATSGGAAIPPAQHEPDHQLQAFGGVLIALGVSALVAERMINARGARTSA